MKARRSDEGAMAILLAAAMVFLFGFAALAVDVGLMQTKRAGLQGVADAAALAGARGGLSTDRVYAMAKANSYENGVGGVTVAPTTDTTTVPTQQRMTVRITAPQSLFFASGLGFAPRTISAQATAVVIPAFPAVLALGTSCASGGVAINSPLLTINGSIGAAAGVNIDGAFTTTVNGDVAYGPCASSKNTTTVTGSFAPGPPAPNPFASIGLGSFTCTTGSLASGDVSYGINGATTGTYCSGGRLDLNWSANFTITASFVARGPITFSGNTGTITAAANQMVAYSESTDDCPSGQAINIGNNTVTFNGSFYAPQGCLNFSGNQMTINGSLVGERVQIQAGSTSAVNGPGGISPGSSFLLQ